MCAFYQLLVICVEYILIMIILTYWKTIWSIKGCFYIYRIRIYKKIITKEKVEREYGKKVVDNVIEKLILTKDTPTQA
jgi:hypothetical protein